MTREEMLADLTYARALAEEGRHAPLLGGAYFVLWGVLTATAFVAQWALIAGYAPRLGGGAFAVLWGGFILLGMGGTMLLARRTRAQPGLSSIGVRAEIAVWTGARMALSAIAVGCILQMVLEQNPLAANAIMGGVFAIYGAALYGSAKLSQQNWMVLYAWLSIAVAVLLYAFANQAWAYLIAAAGSGVVLIAPGLVLLKNEPSAIV